VAASTASHRVDLQVVCTILRGLHHVPKLLGINGGMVIPSGQMMSCTHEYREDNGQAEGKWLAIFRHCQSQVGTEMRNDWDAPLPPAILAKLTSLLRGD